MSRRRLLLHLFRFVVVLAAKNSSTSFAAKERGPSYDQNYKVAYGWDHLYATHQNRDVQLSLDQSSGAEIQSKSSYGSGYFHMRIKLPGKDSAGVVTAFYVCETDSAEKLKEMSSDAEHGSELDYEFLGNREGKPYLVQTNVFADGVGGREQRTYLWFDPTASFHTYRILWNPHQIVFYVDHIPIRVFKNNTDIGVGYPTKPMQIMASIWDGDSWATDGGQTKIDWSHAPFQAHFRSFGIDGCPIADYNTELCYSSKFWWNREPHWALSSNEENDYEDVRNKYLTYDYCTDRPRYPIPPPECPQ